MAALKVDLESAVAALNEKKCPEAEARARSVLRKDPASAEALYVLGAAISDRGDDSEAIRLYQQAIHFDPAFVPAYRKLSKAYYGASRITDAARLYTAWSAIEPDDPEVQHMVAAMTGEKVPVKCSEGYVQNHFNHFSEKFDHVLVERLAYKGPEAMAAALAMYASSEGPSISVLDAGCGTGLCGPAVRARAHTLVGVDLADKMVELARQRGCYDELVVSELCDFMESERRTFDAIISADVLIYFGALDRVICAAHTALNTRGVFIFALEALSDPGADPYRLTASGRYSHRENYLREAMKSGGFDVLDIAQQCLRRENGKEVMFHCVVGRKR